MTGTLVNALAVVVGSIVGLLIHSRFPPRITRIAFQGIGLFTLFIGMQMALKTQDLLIMIFSILIGAVAGELLGLEKGIVRMSDWLKTKVHSRNEKFTEGLVTAFLLFCMGSMTILGAIEEGMSGKPDLLLAKSVLDGFSSIALSASLGAGVLFAVVPLLIYQGGLTLLAGQLGTVLSPPVVNEITATGGLLLIGLGINILEIRKIQVLNMIPALLVAGVLAWLLH
ncbi:MAG: DUF554 domain-containing protein [Acidobacteria bacterium CG_4_9_14_3_um_filter_49_7]|nr:MAG: DUF554 domain-containing protein [Acidobacteria bacterium CG_4_9_14_3_um_filter_49_7]